jgi:Tol biopolymer transport system component
MNRLTYWIVGLGVLSALAAPAAAQVTTRQSLATGGGQGHGPSYSPMFTPDGRYVTFYSEAADLVPGDTNGDEDVFVRDRATGITVRVSVSSTGKQGNWDSYDSVISADARYVAFYSGAYNLVPGDTNGVDDVFVHDLATGTTSRVSVDALGTEGDAQSIYPSISADGRYVAFHSWATNLVPGDTNGVADVFVHDRATGTTIRASVDSAGTEANGDSEYISLSADGSRAAFESKASNLVAGDTNGYKDIFVRDFVKGTTTRVSVGSNGEQADRASSYCSISGDGQSVGYECGATNLIPGDTNGIADSYVHDLDTGITTRVSVSSSGTEGNAISLRAALSHDGRFAAFKSEASNLVPNDKNGVQDVFLHDRRLGKTTRVSVDTNGVEALGRSSTPSISADGRHVGFYSHASNLVPGDTNGVPDVFVKSFYFSTARH